MWSDWEGILAETLRAVLETKCHPQALKDAEFNLKIYDQQVAEEKAKKTAVDTRLGGSQPVE